MDGNALVWRVVPKSNYFIGRCEAASRGWHGPIITIIMIITTTMIMIYRRTARRFTANNNTIGTRRARIRIESQIRLDVIISYATTVATLVNEDLGYI